MFNFPRPNNQYYINRKQCFWEGIGHVPYKKDHTLPFDKWVKSFFFSSNPRFFIHYVHIKGCYFVQDKNQPHGACTVHSCVPILGPEGSCNRAGLSFIIFLEHVVFKNVHDDRRPPLVAPF